MRPEVALVGLSVMGASARVDPGSGRDDRTAVGKGSDSQLL